MNSIEMGTKGLKWLWPILNHEVSTWMTVQSMLFCDVAKYSFVGTYRRFEGICCLNFHS
jgi:hypothetical protein